MVLSGKMKLTSIVILTLLTSAGCYKNIKPLPSTDSATTYGSQGNKCREATVTAYFAARKASRNTLYLRIGAGVLSLGSAALLAATEDGIDNSKEPATVDNKTTRLISAGSALVGGLLALFGNEVGEAAPSAATYHSLRSHWIAGAGLIEQATDSVTEQEALLEEAKGLLVAAKANLALAKASQPDNGDAEELEQALVPAKTQLQKASTALFLVTSSLATAKTSVVRLRAAAGLSFKKCRNE